MTVKKNYTGMSRNNNAAHALIKVIFILTNNNNHNDYYIKVSETIYNNKHLYICTNYSKIL